MATKSGSYSTMDFRLRRTTAWFPGSALEMIRSMAEARFSQGNFPLGSFRSFVGELKTFVSVFEIKDDAISEIKEPEGGAALKLVKEAEKSNAGGGQNDQSKEE